MKETNSYRCASHFARQVLEDFRIRAGADYRGWLEHTVWSGFNPQLLRSQADNSLKESAYGLVATLYRDYYDGNLYIEGQDDTVEAKPLNELPDPHVALTSMIACQDQDSDYIQGMRIIVGHDTVTFDLYVFYDSDKCVDEFIDLAVAKVSKYSRVTAETDRDYLLLFDNLLAATSSTEQHTSRAKELLHLTAQNFPQNEFDEYVSNFAQLDTQLWIIDYRKAQDSIRRARKNPRQTQLELCGLINSTYRMFKDSQPYYQTCTKHLAGTNDLAFRLMQAILHQNKVELQYQEFMAPQEDDIRRIHEIEVSINRWKQQLKCLNPTQLTYTEYNEVERDYRYCKDLFNKYQMNKETCRVNYLKTTDVLDGVVANHQLPWIRRTSNNIKRLYRNIESLYIRLSNQYTQAMDGLQHILQVGSRSNKFHLFKELFRNTAGIAEAEKGAGGARTESPASGKVQVADAIRFLPMITNEQVPGQHFIGWQLGSVRPLPGRGDPSPEDGAPPARERLKPGRLNLEIFRPEFLDGSQLDWMMEAYLDGFRQMTEVQFKRLLERLLDESEANHISLPLCIDAACRECAQPGPADSTCRIKISTIAPVPQPAVEGVASTEKELTGSDVLQKIARGELCPACLGKRPDDPGRRAEASTYSCPESPLVAQPMDLDAAREAGHWSAYQALLAFLEAITEYLKEARQETDYRGLMVSARAKLLFLFGLIRGLNPDAVSETALTLQEAVHAALEAKDVKRAIYFAQVHNIYLNALPISKEEELPDIDSWRTNIACEFIDVYEFTTALEQGREDQPSAIEESSSRGARLKHWLGQFTQAVWLPLAVVGIISAVGLGIGEVYLGAAWAWVLASWFLGLLLLGLSLSSGWNWRHILHLTPRVLYPRIMGAISVAILTWCLSEDFSSLIKTDWWLLTILSVLCVVGGWGYLYSQVKRKLDTKDDRRRAKFRSLDLLSLAMLEALILSTVAAPFYFKTFEHFLKQDLWRPTAWHILLIACVSLFIGIVIQLMFSGGEQDSPGAHSG
ncbi:hypothetical protein JW859_07905 [bacterium]|nr:hypothetical protein [bacterium]